MAQEDQGHRRNRQRPRGRKPHAADAAPAVHTLPVAPAPLTERPPEDTPRFVDLNRDGPIVDTLLVKTITENLKFDRMMPVQAATIYELLPPNRNDCLVQAKTGTGKTLAFLIPAIQTLINKKKGGPGGISLMVLAPTRELAMQIANEATNLLQRMPNRRVCLAVGGTNKNREEKMILAGCDILIATPGRLLDHLSSTPAIQQRLTQLDTLVLDEADRLLDMGFLPDLRSILACLPAKMATNWQGMLFSATVPSHVAQVADLVLAPGYKSISTIPVGEIGTHARVSQLLIQVPEFADLASALVGAIRHEKQFLGDTSFKAIVFAPTAAMADFYGHILSHLPDMPSSWTLHSRHTQSKRTNVTASFRSASTGILVATDVVARGMDFPAVMAIFQVGIPMSKESYIHRLGRTARGSAGESDSQQGRGIFLVAAAEAFFPMHRLKDINFVKEEADLSSAPELVPIIDTMDESQVSKPYQAWLGYYKGYIKPMQWDNVRLVAEANKFARDGLRAASTPSLQKSVVGKMGLRGTPGLVIVSGAPRPGSDGGGGRAGGGGQANGRGRPSRHQK